MRNFLIILLILISSPFALSAQAPQANRFEIGSSDDSLCRFVLEAGSYFVSSKFDPNYSFQNPTIMEFVNQRNLYNIRTVTSNWTASMISEISNEVVRAPDHVFYLGDGGGAIIQQGDTYIFVIDEAIKTLFFAESATQIH